MMCDVQNSLGFALEPPLTKLKLNCTFP